MRVCVPNKEVANLAPIQNAQESSQEMSMAPVRGTHAQPPGRHLLLTLEGEAAIENLHTAERENYVTANADNAVWLNAHTAPTNTPHPPPRYQDCMPGTCSSYTYQQGQTRATPNKGTRTGGHTCASPCTTGCTGPPPPATSSGQPPPWLSPTPEQPAPPGSGPTRAPSSAGQQRPSRPASPATKAS